MILKKSLTPKKMMNRMRFTMKKLNMRMKMIPEYDDDEEYEDEDDSDV